MIERAAFDQFVADVGVETARELIAMFIDEGQRYLVMVHDELASGNLTDLERTAHSLKSMCMTYGAEQMGEAARLLEIAIRDRRRDEFQVLLETLNALAEPTFAAIQDACP